MVHEKPWNADGPWVIQHYNEPIVQLENEYSGNFSSNIPIFAFHLLEKFDFFS